MLHWPDLKSRSRYGHAQKRPKHRLSGKPPRCPLHPACRCGYRAARACWSEMAFHIRTLLHRGAARHFDSHGTGKAGQRRQAAQARRHNCRMCGMCADNRHSFNPRICIHGICRSTDIGRISSRSETHSIRHYGPCELPPSASIRSFEVAPARDELHEVEVLCSSIAFSDRGHQTGRMGRRLRYSCGETHCLHLAGCHR